MRESERERDGQTGRHIDSHTDTQKDKYHCCKFFGMFVFVDPSCRRWRGKGKVR
jgi:hypothetical protein